MKSNLMANTVTVIFLSNNELRFSCILFHFSMNQVYVRPTCMWKLFLLTEYYSFVIIGVIGSIN